MNDTPTEHQEQARVIAWARAHEEEYPGLDVLHASVNGAFFAGDARKRAMQAARLRAAGMLPGVPDLFLPVPRPPYHGLFIEMKRTKGGTVSEEQHRILSRLAALGYCVVVCPGADIAIREIVAYLDIAHL